MFPFLKILYGYIFSKSKHSAFLNAQLFPMILESIADILNEEKLRIRIFWKLFMKSLHFFLCAYFYMLRMGT